MKDDVLVLENFSDRGRQVVTRARDEARSLRHHYVGTEHLLLGILLENQGLAVQVLESFGVTSSRARQEILRIVSPGSDLVTQSPPCTPRVRDTLLRANRMRLSLSAAAVEPQHILLALIRDDGGVAIQVLNRCAVDKDTVRSRLTILEPAD